MDDLPELIKALADYSHDALGFVHWAFPWERDELADAKGPEPWQEDVLRRLSTVSPDHAVLLAVASGHGVGKSALVAWTILWLLSTATDTRGVVTANTETQLRTKTWVELTKWHRRFIGRALFKIEATSIVSIDPERVKTWRCDMVAWSERNPEAFAGLHNQNLRDFVIYDEASSIPDVIHETTEGFLSDQATEHVWLQFGNPTRSIGRFRAAFTDPRWTTQQVDSRSVSFTNKRQIAAWERAYGEDSDFFRVRVRGEFPRVGATEFIPQYAVVESRVRVPIVNRFDSLVLGVDVARFGDDESVIVARKGRDARSIPAIRLRGIDTMALASRIHAESIRLQAAAVFVDEGGVGGGVVDRLRQLRLRSVFGVNFGAKPDLFDMLASGERYANKRAEMWGMLRRWLVEGGGCIEDADELAEQLVGPSYGFNQREEIQLERKVDMKARGLPSPDWADALAITFALPVAPTIEDVLLTQSSIITEYNPFEMELS